MAAYRPDLEERHSPGGRPSGHRVRKGTAPVMLNLLSVKGPGRFVDWGFVHLSVGNLVVIVAMLAVFVLALVLPFPAHPEQDETGVTERRDDAHGTTRTGGAR